MEKKIISCPVVNNNNLFQNLNPTLTFPQNFDTNKIRIFPEEVNNLQNTFYSKGDIFKQSNILNNKKSSPYLDNSNDTNSQTIAQENNIIQDIPQIALIELNNNNLQCTTENFNSNMDSSLYDKRKQLSIIPEEYGDINTTKNLDNIIKTTIEGNIFGSPFSYSKLSETQSSQEFQIVEYEKASINKINYVRAIQNNNNKLETLQTTGNTQILQSDENIHNQKTVQKSIMNETTTKTIGENQEISIKNLHTPLNLDLLKQDEIPRLSFQDENILQSVLLDKKAEIIQNENIIYETFPLIKRHTIGFAYYHPEGAFGGKIQSDLLNGTKNKSILNKAFPSFLKNNPNNDDRFLYTDGNKVSITNKSGKRKMNENKSIKSNISHKSYKSTKSNNDISQSDFHRNIWSNFYLQTNISTEANKQKSSNKNFEYENLFSQHIQSMENDDHYAINTEHNGKLVTDCITKSEII